MPSTLARRSVPDELRDRLATRIYDGIIAAGEPLREEELAASYAVSRGTVREALRTLEHQGLVQRDVHRGCRVTLLTDADIRDIIATRLVVETEAVRRAAEQRLSSPPLQRIATDMQAARGAGDWKRIGELDLVFHSGLVASAGSARLATFFRSQLALLLLPWLRTDEMEAAARLSAPHVDEHAQLLAYIADGDATRADALIRQHIGDAARRLLRDHR